MTREKSRAEIVREALVRASLDERLPDELRAEARRLISNRDKWNLAMERKNSTVH